MIEVTVNGQLRQIKSELCEITIGQFEKFCALISRPDSDFEDALDKYLEIFGVLGLSDTDIDVITVDDYLAAAKSFREIEWDFTEFTREVTIDGVKYVAFTGDKYILPVRDLAKIEKYITKTPTKYFGEMLSIIYKNPELSRDEQSKPEYIAKQADLFREKMTAEVCFPYLKLIGQDLTKVIKDGQPK